MKDKLFDHLQKLNWTFFMMIVLLVIILFFASTIKYMFVQQTEEDIIAANQNSLDVIIKENTVQDVYGAPRPIVVLEVVVNKPSLLNLELTSEKYETSFRTSGYTTSFEKMFFIPPDAHSTRFVVKATARDKEGKSIEKEIELETKKVLTPKFNIS
ncbi:hypothetical protein ACFL96_04580 [Thermoproteota archaeon]